MYAETYWWDFATAQFAMMGVVGALWGVLLKFFVGQVITALKKHRAEARHEHAALMQELQELRLENARPAAPGLALTDDAVIWDEIPGSVHGKLLIAEADKAEYARAA